MLFRPQFLLFLYSADNPTLHAQTQQGEISMREVVDKTNLCNGEPFVLSPMGLRGMPTRDLHAYYNVFLRNKQD